MLIFDYRLQLWECMRPVVFNSNGATVWAPLCLLLGYRNYYAIHRSLYTPAHVLIENTLVLHKMTKNSRMVLCCQNRGSKGTGWCYRLHSSAIISCHSALITVLGSLKKGEEGEERISTKQPFCRFQVSYLKHANSSYKWTGTLPYAHCCLATYFYM